LVMTLVACLVLMAPLLVTAGELGKRAAKQPL